MELCSLRLSLQTDRELCSPQELAAALKARGHTVSVLTSVGGGTGIAAFRNLRHTFLTIAAPPPCPPQPHQQLPSPLRGGRAAAAAASDPDWAVGGPEQQGHEDEGEEEEEEELLHEHQLLLCGDPAGCSEHTIIVDPHFKCQVRAWPHALLGVAQGLAAGPMTGRAGRQPASQAGRWCISVQCKAGCCAALRRAACE